MTRLPRFDAPGRWFHVMNRGIARRVVFRGRRDMRTFLALLALAVRRGEVEVHAFALMPTHFHLLVRSPIGRLSEALRRIQNEYVRYFNRATRRDGPLFRGRFRSRPVLSLRYRTVLVRYIDENPVAARIVRQAHEYPYGSAVRHMSHRRPKWLAGTWIDEAIQARRLVDPQASYAQVWGRAPSPAERALVEARLAAPACVRDELDDLVGATPAGVLAWMKRKASLADGTRPDLPLVAASHVLEVVRAAQRELGPWTDSPPRRGRPADLWAVATVGLLHDLAGMTATAASARLACARPGVAVRLTRHRRLLHQAPYAQRITELAAACLAGQANDEGPRSQGPAGAGARPRAADGSAGDVERAKPAAT